MKAAKIMKQTQPSLARILLALMLVFLIFGNVGAQAPVDNLKDSISEKQKELEQLNTEIVNLQKEINRKQREAASLKNEVSLFDLQIRQLEIQIQAVEVEITKLSAEILKVQIAIQEKEEQIQRQKERLAENLRLIYEFDNVTPLEMTLRNQTFSEFLDQAQYAANLQEGNQELLLEMRGLKSQLEQKKQELLAKSDEHQKLQAQLLTAKGSLQLQRSNRQYLLTQTRGQERLYQSLLSDASEKQEQVEREIFELEVAIRQKLGDKSLPPIAGLLRWPMSGVITQGYGNTGFRALGYSFHNGIDIAAPAGTKIYSAGDGLVYAIGTGKAAYGNWVVIKHTLTKDSATFNIYTLYAHLQRSAVAVGQAVRGGDIIGYEGNSGNTTRLLYGPEAGYHLHFTIFDEEGFGIKKGQYSGKFGEYDIPYGYTYNPMNFLK